MNGYLYSKINPLLRVALVAGGLGMMVPGTITDVVGLVLVVAVVVYQRMMAKRLSPAV